MNNKLNIFKSRIYAIIFFGMMATCSVSGVIPRMPIIIGGIIVTAYSVGIAAHNNTPEWIKPYVEIINYFPNQRKKNSQNAVALEVFEKIKETQLAYEIVLKLKAYDADDNDVKRAKENIFDAARHTINPFFLDKSDQYKQPNNCGNIKIPNVNISKETKTSDKQ